MSIQTQLSACQFWRCYVNRMLYFILDKHRNGYDFRGLAPDPAGGAYSAFPDLQAEFKSYHYYHFFAFKWGSTFMMWLAINLDKKGA